MAFDFTDRNCDQANPSPSKSGDKVETRIDRARPQTGARARFIFVCFLVTTFLLASAGLAALWWHSVLADGPEVLCSWKVGEIRYTIRSESGRIVLRRPRPVPGVPPQSKLWLSQLSNDDIVWRSDLLRKQGTDVWSNAYPGGFTGTTESVFAQLERQPWLVGERIMLAALEDPNRFAAAHLWLSRYGGGGFSGSVNTYPKVTLVNGLRVEARVTSTQPAIQSSDLRTVQGRTNRYEYYKQPPTQELRGEPSIHIDTAQIPNIVRQWHDRQDRSVYSVSYAVPVFICSVPPLALFVAYWLRRRAAARRAAGHCISCGYDLRASRECCPECGRPIAAVSTSPDASTTV